MRRPAVPALLLVAGLVCAVAAAFDAVAPPPAAAQRRNYTIDTDPIRLGDRALEQGRLPGARQHYEEAVANEHHVREAYLGLARIAVREGRYPDAEANYRQALAAAGDSFPEARAGLALLLLRLGRELEAEQELEQALARDDKVWAAHYGMARRYLAAGEWEKARRELERGEGGKGVTEGEDLYHHGTALYHLGKGDVAEAEKSALRAMHLNPADPEHSALVARIYEQRGTRTLAIQAYEQALATPGMEPTAPMMHALGRLYGAENRFNDAAERYRQAVAVDSTYAPAVKDLADLLRRADRHEMAARTYLRYVELDPENVDALLGLAETLYEVGRYTSAAEAARAALRLDPASDAAALALARAGIHSSDDAVKAEAAQLMQKLPADSGWTARDLVALAAWQTELRRFEEAQASLERAAQLDAELFEVPFQQGVVALRAGRPDAAARYFQRAAGLRPQSAAAHLNLGIARYQAGSVAEAVPALREALAQDEDLVLARLLLAQALAATGQESAAEQQYQGVLEREPQNAKALRGLGFCRIRQSDYAGAVDAYRRATEAEPGNADAWAGLGSAYLGLERYDDAEAAFAKARAIDPENIMLVKGTEILNQARNAEGR
ncbi:MAG: tetratricopeptide repeat protein [Candidatus Krumholzibacteriia bacterium]